MDAMVGPWHDEGWGRDGGKVWTASDGGFSVLPGPSFPRSSCHDLIMASMPRRCSAGRGQWSVVAGPVEGMGNGVDAMVGPWHDEGEVGTGGEVWTASDAGFPVLVGSSFPRSSCHDLIMASMPQLCGAGRGQWSVVAGPVEGMGNGVDAMVGPWHDEGEVGTGGEVWTASDGGFSVLVGSSFPLSSCHDLIMASMPRRCSAGRGQWSVVAGPVAGMGNGVDAMVGPWHDEGWGRDGGKVWTASDGGFRCWLAPRSPGRHAMT
jgi:hypothetical protein